MNIVSHIDTDLEFQKLSKTLAKKPLVLNNWEKIINHLLKNYYKNSKLEDEDEKQKIIILLRDSYESMLTIFPYLENYVIEYANFELEQGNYKKFHIIYKESLRKMNNRSLLLWVSYLKTLVDKKTLLKIERKFLLHKFEDAEKYIGKHYHSQPFWNIYLLFLKKYYISNPTIYLSKLRQLLGLHIYDFAYNFRLWFKELESVNDLKQLNLFYNMKKMEIPKLLKPREKLELMKFKIKNIYKKMYKKIEIKVMKLYNNYELPLTVYKQSNLYYTSPKIPLSPTFVQLWVNYITYAISTKDKYYTMLIFQRALISSSMAHSKIVWLYYIKWLTSCKDYTSAKEILKQSIHFTTIKRN
ncbi:hypothetical protein HANVADRAFT_47194 [Hanseniaspora valbyensis NRRL Y-1626]|uniref:U3 small nucleolar RNA-associated protein 6 n=1 Tax=Hanseniaspora valbyensis NRRL Y-1626 TaxID=766949 RepID=A0A1B7TIE3_9ASCO|nr:hypothetical protein HANVADRAFT_47194 [Hanseniaspora valbyensis NRRL Y-1626]